MVSPAPGGGDGVVADCHFETHGNGFVLSCQGNDSGEGPERPNGPIHGPTPAPHAPPQAAGEGHAPPCH